MGFFEKLKQGLSKTASSISSVFTASELDDEFYDDLEESLIVSDLGMDTTEAVMDRLRQPFLNKGNSDGPCYGLFQWSEVG